MNEFDRAIRQSLSAEDAELFDRLGAADLVQKRVRSLPASEPGTEPRGVVSHLREDPIPYWAFEPLIGDDVHLSVRELAKVLAADHQDLAVPIEVLLVVVAGEDHERLAGVAGMDGSRQRLRERSGNVIDVAPEREAVARTVADAAARARGRWTNVYGDGHAAEKIIELLGRLALDRALLEKTNAY